MSSETPTDRDQRPSRQWVHVVLLASFLVLAVAPLIFIGWHYHFRWSVSQVVLSLGWVAVVLSVYYLWETGRAMAEDDRDDATWWRPTGERDELMREKRSLLKAIKETEFDREMGKVNDADAGEIVRMYRARAIEVIKALDALDAGGEGSVKDEIEREVRARLEVKDGAEAAAAKKAAKKKGGKKAKAAPAAKEDAS